VPRWTVAVAQTTLQSGASICDGRTGQNRGQSGIYMGQDLHTERIPRAISHSCSRNNFGRLYATATVQSGSGHRHAVGCSAVIEAAVEARIGPREG